MLKKAGIVVAAAAAGLLAVSPLAFAGDKGDHGHSHGQSENVNSVDNVNSVSGDDTDGLFNVSGNNVNVPVQVCNNDVPIQLGSLQSQARDITGALALFGNADSDSIVIADNSRECGDNSGSAGDVSEQDFDSEQDIDD